jgi:hypothetical protein
MNNNGTPFTDEQWKAWYGHKSNKERFMEQQEFEAQERADREADDYLLEIIMKNHDKQ